MPLSRRLSRLAATSPATTAVRCPPPSAASAPLELVLELVVDGLRYEYEDPIEQVAYDSVEGGYLLPVDDTWDLIWDLGISEREDVLKDVIGAIQQAVWCQRNPYPPLPPRP
jgi:HEPN/RES N-terminal domain 1